MYFKQFNDMSVKLYLSDEELINFGLEPTNITPDIIENNVPIMSLLNELKEQLGESTKPGTDFIEFIKGDGGYAVYISSVPDDELYNEVDYFNFKNLNQNFVYLTYTTDKMSNIMRLAECFESRYKDCINGSELYENSGEYVLILKIYKEFELKISNILIEFGGISSNETVDYYYAVENFNVIIGGKAIEQLHRYQTN
ncbi:MAG: adaptor protein MecA [Ruminococcus sp.]|nr:adaptor protein MecA [Ruminococcus sp.]